MFKSHCSLSSGKRIVILGLLNASFLLCRCYRGFPWVSLKRATFKYIDTSSDVSGANRHWNTVSHLPISAVLTVFAESLFFSSSCLYPHTTRRATCHKVKARIWESAWQRFKIFLIFQLKPEMFLSTLTFYNTCLSWLASIASFTSCVICFQKERKSYSPFNHTVP